MTHISSHRASFHAGQRLRPGQRQRQAQTVGVKHPRPGLLDRLNPFSAKGNSDHSFGFVDSVKKHAWPIGTGIGGAVMGFFLGGPPGAIVGAAVGAGMGFLLPKVFDGVIKLIKNHMPPKPQESYEPPQADDPIRQDEHIFNESPHSFQPQTDTPDVYEDLPHHHHPEEDVPPSAEQETAPPPSHLPPFKPSTESATQVEKDYANYAAQLKNNRNQGFDHYRSQRPLYDYQGRRYQNLNSLEGGSHIGGQTHYPPLQKGNGDGKTVYMFIGFKGTRHDQGMRRSVEPFFVDDVQRMRNHGYKVVVDTRGTQAAFQKAVDDDNNAGIIWAGHGVKTGIQDSKSGHIFTPNHIRPNPKSQMRFCIFETCLAGHSEKAWESRLNTDVKAHNRVIYTSEIREFADPDPFDKNELDDFISRELVQKPW